MVTTFSSLPNEIQRMVSGNIDKISYKCQCMLVSKSWYLLFMDVLYSDVHFDKFSQLEKFRRTLECNDYHLKNFVKRLTIHCKIDYTSYDQNITVSKLFTCLPDLEYLDCSVGGYYRLILDALLTDKLLRLKELEPSHHYLETEDDDDDYISCALSMKDRLEHLTLWEPLNEEEDPNEDADDVNRERREDSIRFYRLFDLLDHFKNIRHLNIAKKSNNIIDLIEKATYKCPLMTHLSVDFEANDEEGDALLTVDDVVNLEIVPAPTVINLQLTGNVFSNLTLVRYTIHKFPRLRVLKIDAHGAGAPTCLEEITLSPTLAFLTNLKYARISQVPITDQSATALIGSFWKRASQDRILDVTFSNDFINLEYLNIELERDKCAYNWINTLSNTGLAHGDLIEKYGQFIDSLTFRHLILTDTSTSDNRNEFSIFNTFTNCTRLKKLFVMSSTLIWADPLSSGALSEKRTIETLEIRNCGMRGNFTFGNLSKLLIHVEYLNLYEVHYRDSRYNKEFPLKSIGMPETSIGTLSFSKYNYICGETKERVVLVNLLIQEDRYYYVYDFDVMDDSDFSSIGRELFDIESKKNQCLILDISCKALKSLEVHHLSKTLKLTII